MSSSSLLPGPWIKSSICFYIWLVIGNSASISGSDSGVQHSQGSGPLTCTPTLRTKLSSFFLDKPLSSCFYKEPITGSQSSPPPPTLPQAPSSLPLWNTKRLLILPGSEQHSDLARTLLRGWAYLPNGPLAARHSPSSLDTTKLYLLLPASSLRLRGKSIVQLQALYSCAGGRPDTAHQGQIWAPIVLSRADNLGLIPQPKGLSYASAPTCQSDVMTLCRIPHAKGTLAISWKVQLSSRVKGWCGVLV